MILLLNNKQVKTSQDSFDRGYTTCEM